MSILVIGATGSTGRPLTALLRERGAEVRAASRHPGPDDVYFDWADPGSHREALDGVRSVFLLPPLASIDPMPMVGPFLESARAAGVRRAVLLGSLVVLPNSPGLDALRESVRRLPEWAVLRPSGFMQNFTGAHPVATGIRERHEIITAAGNGRLGWVDATDIAAVAAELLLAPTATQSEHILTGPETLSYADATAIIGAHTGEPIRQVDSTVDALAQRYLAAGLPADFATELAAVDANIRAGFEDRATSTVRDLTGRPPRSFREFVRTHPEWAG